jgi:hypothetical protein
LVVSAIFNDMSFSNYGVFYSSSFSSSSYPLHIFSNCSFKNINTTGDYSPAITIDSSHNPLKVENCIFDNLISTSPSVLAGVLYLNTEEDDGYSYSFSENIISNIESTKSAICIIEYPSNLFFSNNSFVDIKNVNSYGGVLFFFFIIYAFD